MCGIAGYFGSREIEKSKIIKTLDLMKFRGPDNREVKKIKISQKTLYFLHSRLSIIDLEARSNQPFETDDLILIFNGGLLRKEDNCTLFVKYMTKVIDYYYDKSKTKLKIIADFKNIDKKTINIC